MTDQDDAERALPRLDRGGAIMAFLGAGLHDQPSSALAVDALARARHAVAGYRARSESVDDCLAGEVRVRGIRENAAVLAVLEVPRWRGQAAERFRQDHPERAQALAALLAVLDQSAATA